jgi:hypothetical protein
MDERAARRERVDAEILASLTFNAEANAAEYAVWECTIADGLDEPYDEEPLAKAT